MRLTVPGGRAGDAFANRGLDAKRGVDSLVIHFGAFGAEAADEAKQALAVGLMSVACESLGRGSTPERFFLRVAWVLGMGASRAMLLALNSCRLSAPPRCKQVTSTKQVSQAQGGFLR